MIADCKALVKFTAGFNPVDYRITVTIATEILPADSSFGAGHPLADLKAPHLDFKGGNRVKANSFDKFHDLVP